MPDIDADYRKNIDANMRRLKWLADRRMEIRVVAAPHQDGVYRYYELRAVIPGRNPNIQCWVSFGRQGESLDSLVDRMMANETRGETGA